MAQVLRDGSGCEADALEFTLHRDVFTYLWPGALPYRTAEGQKYDSLEPRMAAELDEVPVVESLAKAIKEVLDPMMPYDTRACRR